MSAIRPKALVVDDEENVRYIAATALRLDGWDVAEAATAAQARAQLGDFRPDLVVLDVMLDDQDGFTLCRRWRQEGMDCPVIFLTARTSASDRVTGLTIGGDDYLTKPFSVEELLARCRLRLRGPGHPEPERLRCADLELDPAAHRVTRAGAEIALSPTEYRLLHYLLLNTGRVLTRPQILERIWGYDGADGSTLESFISFLRRKIDTVEPPLIHTVRGFGYVLRERP